MHSNTGCMDSSYTNTYKPMSGHDGLETWLYTVSCIPGYIL